MNDEEAKIINEIAITLIKYFETILELNTKKLSNKEHITSIVVNSLFAFIIHIFRNIAINIENETYLQEFKDQLLDQFTESLVLLRNK